MTHRRRAPLIACGLLLLSASAQAGETITYTYDVHGRLVKVSHSGTVNNGVATHYAFDKADNRAQLVGGNGVYFSVSDASAWDGQDVVFTVIKAGAATANTTVSYSTAHGTAGSSDYSSRSGTLTFTPSETTKTVAVPTFETGFGDAVREEFYLNISTTSPGAAIADAQAVGTITD